MSIDDFDINYCCIIVLVGSDHLGYNCIVFENFTASIGDLMVAN